MYPYSLCMTVPPLCMGERWQDFHSDDIMLPRILRVKEVRGREVDKTRDRELGKKGVRNPG